MLKDAHFLTMSSSENPKSHLRRTAGCPESCTTTGDLSPVRCTPPSSLAPTQPDRPAVEGIHPHKVPPPGGQGVRYYYYLDIKRMNFLTRHKETKGCDGLT